jgi:ABC-type Mn2+/Zn2+ transport system ATPase subunit
MQIALAGDGSSTSEVLLAVDKLSVHYGETTAIEDISFSLRQGEVVALIGPNGAGKSTLFRALCGLVRHTGDVHVAGQHCHHLDRKRVGYIPQLMEANLTFPILVKDVVLAGRRRFGRIGLSPSASDRRIVGECLAAVDLEDAEGSPLSRLSGGQIQRVFIARAMAQEADVLLLDEAASGVDEKHADELFKTFERLADRGKAVLLSSHNISYVVEHFSRTITLNKTIRGDGNPREILSPDRISGVFGR